MAFSDNKRKRFIAGAVCPQCNSVDKTYTLTGCKGVSRHCLDCHFTETLEDLAASQKETENVDVQVIKLPGS